MRNLADCWPNAEIGWKWPTIISITELCSKLRGFIVGYNLYNASVARNEKINKH